MKRAIALVLVLVMVLSISTIALAAPSPTGGTVTGETTGGTTGGAAVAVPVEVKAASAEAKTALEAAVADQLKDKLKDGQTTSVVATFGVEKGGRVEANAAGVKAGDTVYVLFRAKDGTIKLIKAVAKDGKVVFSAPAEGDFTIVLVSGGANTVPSTGDSNRMLKLVLAGFAAIAVMTVAGVAIKRSNG